MEMIPYDKRSGKIWFNGGTIDWGSAKIHLLSHGLHYASCVFEGERVYDGEIFKLEEHTLSTFIASGVDGQDPLFHQRLLELALDRLPAVAVWLIDATAEGRRAQLWRAE